MAVYTPVSDVEVTEFLQNYEIGDLISLTEITAVSYTHLRAHET